MIRAPLFACKNVDHRHPETRGREARAWLRSGGFSSVLAAGGVEDPWELGKLVGAAVGK
jgi:hypothetical protein